MAELMKGHVFSEREHTVRYPCIAEVKYDEIRQHVKYSAGLAPDCTEQVEFLSYSGKPIANMGEFSERFLTFFRENPAHTELDMGLLVNGNFNDSYRWARSTKGCPKEKLDKKTGKVSPALDTSMVQFLLFDVPSFGYLPFDTDTDPVDMLDRRAVRHAARQELIGVGLPMRAVSAYTISAEAGLRRLFTIVREEGYEGLMVKSCDHTYEKGKRTDGWLKMKPEAEADGVIVSINQAIAEDGTPHDRAGSVTIRMEDGSMASPHGIPHALGALMLKYPERYLGTWMTMNYMERDRAGGYRHPTFGRLREDK